MPDRLTDERLNCFAYHESLDDLLHTLNSMSKNDSKSGRLAYDCEMGIRQLRQENERLRERLTTLQDQIGCQGTLLEQAEENERLRDAAATLWDLRVPGAVVPLNCINTMSDLKILTCPTN